MKKTSHLLSIGVNTGNSLDAADVVLTRFGCDGSMIDLDALSLQMPTDLSNRLRSFRAAVMDADGDVEKAIQSFERENENESGAQLIETYTLYVADAVNQLTERYKHSVSKDDSTIDVIGFHGQTCAHNPPSIAKDKETVYTIQIGDGQLLADRTGYPVIYDFRSDDVMNEGEGAPLAPVHHQRLAGHLRSSGKFPIAFCNAGNTGNISVITESAEGKASVSGWDVGPFNDYPDKLVQAERGIACDTDGAIGIKGKVDPGLLQLLFDKGAVTANGANFLLQPPPKSSDPQWYRLLPELQGEAPVHGSILSFEDRLRTAEYFAAYVYFYSLNWIGPDLKLPKYFALCGGGWNNPICRSSLEGLLHGEHDVQPILEEHREIFADIYRRLKETSKDSPVEIAMADEFGFSGQYMEARLFADAAVCRIMALPFSRPETTGCRAPSILGIMRFPEGNFDRASQNLKEFLAEFKSKDLTPDDPVVFDGRWSRAARGWHRKLK